MLVKLSSKVDDHVKDEYDMCASPLCGYFVPRMFPDKSRLLAKPSCDVKRRVLISNIMKCQHPVWMFCFRDVFQQRNVNVFLFCRAS